MLKVIDAHHHLWDPAAGYAWMRAGAVKFMGDTASVCTRYEVEDLLAEARAADVELIGSVHLQCGRNPQAPAEESAWVQQQADRSALPMAIVGYANLADAQLDAVLAQHAASAGFRGVRQMLNWGDEERYRLCDRGDYLRDAAWQAGFARLGERGLSFDLQLNSWQLPDAARLVDRHAGTTVIVNHAGLPFDEPAWRDGMREMAAHPQVHVKFSGLGMVDPHWTAQSARPLFDFLLAQFGAGRMMFASNFPIDRVYKTYRDVFAAFDQLSSGLDATQREALFSGTAARVYRIDMGARSQ